MKKESIDAFDDVEIKSTEDLGASWREAPRRWGHSMHKLAPYVGGFPPALANYFIQRYSNPGDLVYDPFCGGGTTPLEAVQLNRQAAGNDAFSYAYILSSAKCNPIPTQSAFEDYLDSVEVQIENLQPSQIPTPDDNIRIFFHKKTLSEILRYREVLKDNNSREAIFLKALISGILHGSSDGFLSVQTKDTFSGTPDYVREYLEKNDIEPEYRNVREKAISKYKRVIQDAIPSQTGKITQGDARNIYSEDPIDLILTSPPYMHKLDYTWNNWLRLWWLNRNKDKERDNLDITADLEKYQRFIEETLSQMYNILSPDARAVIIIGDVKKHLAAGTKVIVPAKIIANKARSLGFEVELAIDDAYDMDKRNYTQFNKVKYEGQISDDDDINLIDRCIVLSKGNPKINNIVDPSW